MYGKTAAGSRFPFDRQVFFFVILLCVLHCGSDRQNTLAIVGTRRITRKDFSERFSSVSQRMNLPDNLLTRKEILSGMIDEYLLIEEARKSNYHEDALGRAELENLKMQELLNAYIQRNISKPADMDEAELKELFQRLHTQIRARHLYAQTRRQADSLAEELMSGKSFETLAKSVFKDPQLRDTGGDLGYFTVDEMDPFFEEAAFGLKIGKISSPVRTAQGYSIIQLTDRHVQPLLTESDYTRQRPKLAVYLRQRKMKKRIRMVTDSLRQALKVEFDQPAVRDLVRIVNSRNTRSGMPEYGPLLSEDNPLLNRTIAWSSDGAWTMESLQLYARFTKDNQLQWVHQPEQMEDFLAGLIVRIHLLEEARKQGLHQETGFERQVENRMHDFLLRRMEDGIAANVVIPEDSMRACYREDGDLFIVPPAVELREIVLDNESDTSGIRQKLLNGASFESMAKAYSVNRRSAENGGEIGFFSAADLGEYAEPIFSLKSGQWTGPIEIRGQFAFIQCIGKRPQRQPSYEEAEHKIRESLFPFYLKRTRQETLRQIREHIRVTEFPDQLQSVRLH
ncbi:peptidylprolyl isomerase [bacterium]|nr:peptidylprolyl isomerase [bacterium]